MSPAQRQQLSHYIETGFLFVWGIVLLLLPLVFSTLNTDPFILPKQILLAAVVVLSLVVWGVKMIIDKQVKIRRTPFDIPVLLFALALLLSSIFAVDKADSLLAVVPVIFAVFAFFIVVNAARKPQAGLFLIASLLTGGVATTLINALAQRKIYVLPFLPTHVQGFTPFGSYVDQAVYLVVLIPLVIPFVLPILKKGFTPKAGGFSAVGLILLAGLAWSVYALFTSQKPTLLPFEVGFQTAFAAISQDTGRIAQGFFFGSGFGTYSTVFTRFHPASLNANNQLWYLSFNTSSSFVLELLATTGIIGLLGFLFLLLRVLFPLGKKIKNPLFPSLIVLSALAFFLPFSFTLIALFFLLLGLFALYQLELSPHQYFDIELKFVALKKGVISFVSPAESVSKASNPTPIFAFVILLALAVVLGYYSTTYVLADTLFQSSLVAANQNNGVAAYKDETQAISTFPYRSAYYRVFSETNIALANSLLALNTGNGSSPSASAQQTAYTLVQQAITTARQATTISPQDPIEWQNLASVYRALIGVGQNAENFSIAATQQAVVLDPSNPQEYLTLGGIYYQLGQYDNALRYFQQAAALKQDYANAYYNVAHAYEQKQDYQDAIANLQTVQQLVGNDKTNADKIAAEIKDLQDKAGTGTTTSQSQQNAPQTQPSPTTAGSQQPLSVPEPSTTLAPQKNQIPLVSPTPAK